jgi:hypothetical protein
MRTIAAAAVTCCLIAGPTRADEVQMFNTEVLGHKTSEALKLLVDREPGQVEPVVVWADVKCGKYIAGSAFYPRPTRLSDVVAQLNKLYAGFNVMPDFIWRVSDKGLTIQVADEKDREAIRITFISYNFLNGEPCPAAP